MYEDTARAQNLADDVSGEGRTLKSAPTLDSDDLIAILKYLQTLAYVDKNAIGIVGVSHSGEMILKIAAETTFAAGVAIEGASHEFLSVNTGPTAPRKGNEIQYQDIEVVRKNADKARAMERIRRIADAHPAHRAQCRPPAGHFPARARMDAGSRQGFDVGEPRSPGARLPVHVPARTTGRTSRTRFSAKRSNCSWRFSIAT